MSLSSNDHTFCRTLLKLTMADVRKAYTVEEITRAWAWDSGIGGRRTFEFHGPQEEYLYNLNAADCKWSAAAEGWRQLLQRREEPSADAH